MSREAIILAGGMGTRLKGTVPDLPKAMAPVAGRPFLSFVIDSFRMAGVDRFIFSLGHQAASITDYLAQEYPTLDYKIVKEEIPLGTGGAVRLAISEAQEENVVVANGDTLFKTDIEALYSLHQSKRAECTLSLKPMSNFERYGVVEMDEDGRITNFREKQFYAKGLINGGLYVLDKKRFLRRPFPQSFSLEKDYLEKCFKEGTFFGSVQDGYFIDIGIPADYARANDELRQELHDLKKIDCSWTLFLDRDGVINEETVGRYVLHWGEFIFSKGVLDVFKKLSTRFGRIIIVCNQRGVGRGLMTEAALQSIHLEMQREVEIVHGRIDRIYYCTDRDEKSFNRKPNPGMAVQAAKDFPDIDLSKSIMVGNKPSDMRFGRYAGMVTVFVKTTNPDQVFPHPDIDFVYPSLYDFASDL
ncbi:MAG TPA: HAD-IIIA family hydrolase [Flavisolibacter sp.]|nr:HAD-IIIA family hydrolase [Flavisolibacter sp.]